MKIKNETVLNKIILTAALAVLLFTAFTAVASAATIYVPEGGNQTIQAAVNNASSGDTIIVRDAYTGTKENIVVNVTHLTIQSENGTANCTVNASSSCDHVFEVTANYVNISRFTVENATGDDKAGIYLGSNVEHCNISDNNVTNNYDGIYLSHSNNNTLTNNTANSNNYFGIYLTELSNYNNVTSNTADSNNYFGIYLYSSSSNNITNNTVSNNDYGIYLFEQQQHHEQHRQLERPRHLPGIFEQLQQHHGQHR